MTAKLRPKTHDGVWNQVLVRTLQAGQPRPYADSIYEYEVTFTGGTPSSREGMELAFATMPPFDPERWKNVVWSKPARTMQEREIEHYDRIKEMIRPHVREWSWDRTRGDSGLAMAPYLEVFEHVPAKSDSFSNTYRVKIIGPFCD